MSRESEENDPNETQYNDEVLGLARGKGDPDYYGYPGEPEPTEEELRAINKDYEVKPQSNPKRDTSGKNNANYGNRISDRDRLLKYITKNEDCWEWTGRVQENGYGKTAHWKNGKSTTISAHRLSYMTFIGPILDGYTIDHLCMNRKCINPAHLEAVTIKENIYRSPNTVARINSEKTHCAKGHEYTPENTIIQRGRSPQRVCRTCRTIYNKRKSLKKRLIKEGINGG